MHQIHYTAPETDGSLENPSYYFFLVLNLIVLWSPQLTLSTLRQASAFLTPLLSSGALGQFLNLAPIVGACEHDMLLI